MPHSQSSLVAIVATVVALGGCIAGQIGEPEEADGTVGSDGEAVAAAVFVRSDQVHFGRAPHNTGDLSQLVNDDFSNPGKAAKAVNAWLDEHPGYRLPIYLGCIHTWIYDTDATYRANVHALAAEIEAHEAHPILLYFEERNASHAPHPVSAGHAAELRKLAHLATLLLATYADGYDGHGDVVAIVKAWKHWYHGVLKVPMASMMIDVDLSQTPANFYYGSRGHLANFNHVVRWELDAAYDQGFAGFHTYGNVGGNYGTKRADDSTYQELDDAWHDLVKAHPKQAFSGID